jgi:hypothetical protein
MNDPHRHRTENGIAASHRDIARLPIFNTPGDPPTSIEMVRVKQHHHGFSVGQVVAWNGSAYVLALNDSASDGAYIGVVSQVYNVNAFDVTLSGLFSIDGLPTLTPGAIYFLSSTVAGLAVTPVDPAGYYAGAVFQCINATTINVFPFSSILTVAAAKPTNVIVDLDINVASHGFTVGQVLYKNGSTYALSKADAIGTAVYAGVVSKVEDVNHFDLTYAGILTFAHGLTVGALAYLSDTTAGQLSSTAPPETHYQVPVVFALDAATLLVLSSSGIASSPTALHAGDGTVGGGTLRVYSTATCYVDIDNTGTFTITLGNGNVCRISPADVTGQSNLAIQMRPFQVCDTGSGTIKTSYILASAPL